MPSSFPASISNRGEEATVKSPTYPIFYPLLGGVRDLGCMRVSGVGLGNSFFTYFHTLLLSKAHGGRLIYPAWPSFRIGPMLRGESRKRFYVGLFQPTFDEISGVQKYALLAKFYNKKHIVAIERGEAKAAVSNGLNFVSCSDFTFHGLANHRAEIRERLLRMINVPTPKHFGWGKSNYIAIHVRMGDFAAPSDASALNRGIANTRIPVSWYVGILERLRAQYPDKPALVVSDGHEEELRELLNAGATLHKTDSDIGDLLALSSASILVGSNSTFSRWATFLGGMPSIWVRRSDQDEMMLSDGAAVSYIPIGTENRSAPILLT